VPLPILAGLAARAIWQSMARRGDAA
jgi:hypothetical protein